MSKITAKSIPRFWKLQTGPTYWQKPVSLSKNREDPFNSGSPGAARAVHIHQTLTTNSRSWSLIPASPVSSSTTSAVFQTAEAHSAGEMKNSSPQLKTNVQALHFAAGPRFLETRLWHLSNLQRCLHNSTHGSANTLTVNQSSTLMNSQKVVLLQREPAPRRPMCLAWDISL